MKCKGKGIICLKDELSWKLPVKSALTALIDYSWFRIFLAMSKTMKKNVDVNCGGSGVLGIDQRDSDTSWVMSQCNGELNL